MPTGRHRERLPGGPNTIGIFIWKDKACIDNKFSDYECQDGKRQRAPWYAGTEEISFGIDDCGFLVKGTVNFQR